MSPVERNMNPIFVEYEKDIMSQWPIYELENEH